MSNGDVRRIRQRFTDAMDAREPAHESFRAVLGDGLGNVEVPGSPNECFARIEGRTRFDRVTITEVPKINSLPVICSYTPGNPTVLQVTEIDWTAMPPDIGVLLLQPHHEIHEHLNPEGGYDTVWVSPTQFVEGLGHPTSPISMQLQVQKFKYPWGVTMNCFPGDWTVDLSAYLPTVGNSRYVLVSVDGATNALQYAAGTVFPSWPSPSECANLPAIPVGSVPIVYALLVTRNNLLTNDVGFTTSGFETAGAGAPDLFAYWIETWGLGLIADDLAIVYEGLHSCRLTEGGGGRDTDVYQDFNVVPGRRYQFRFWTRGDGGANDGAYRVYDVSNAADIIATTGTGQLAAAWIEITAVFVAPAGCTVARVYFYCPAAGVSQAWFDAPTVALVTDNLDWPDLLDARLFLELVGVAGGATTFLALTDTPANYVGDALKLVRVNAVPNALEFTTDLPDHDHSGDVGDGGQLDHGDLLGLADDDHLQYALLSGVRPFVGTVALNVGMIFAGASGVNAITVPDNLANAAHIVDVGGLEYLRVVSTNAQPILYVNQGAADIDFRVDSAGFAPALFVQGSDGYVGVNTVPTFPFHATLTTTIVAGVQYNAYVDVFANPGAGSAAIVRAMAIGAYVQAANAQNITGSIAGLYGFAYHQGTGTLATAYGNLYAVYMSGGGTITDSRCIYLETALLHGAGGDTIGTAHGLYIQAPYWIAGKTIGTQYGIKLTNHFSAGTVCWSIYSEGGTMQLHTGGAGVPGLYITAAASQTANLQEWRNSAGTPLMEVEAGGCIDFRWAMGNSTKNPHLVAEDDWVECKIGGNTYYLPAYLA